MDKTIINTNNNNSTNTTNNNNRKQSFIFINSLPPLIDIFDTLEHEYLLNEGDIEDITHHILPILFEYTKSDIKMYNKNKYKDILYDFVYENVYELVLLAYPHDNIEDDVERIIPVILKLFNYIIPKRSLKSNYIIYNQNDDIKQQIKAKLHIIDIINSTLPEQRTKEWYEMRYDLLSASSIWKCIDSEANKNSIIYDKCTPLNTDKYNSVNMNSPMHWGQKYEPVSQGYYEFVYDAEIKEYGCIPHMDKENCGFLGASPDGINVKYSSERYGRMLEIKNIFNRDITGIPKKEYWVQTQLQMECCNLDECDFLECRFKEYSCQEDFIDDGETFLQTGSGKYKGIYIQFYYDGKPHYEYPIFQISKDDFDIWRHDIIEKNREKTWVADIYWRLEEVSCVLIQRNKVWFECVLPEFREVWSVIEKERIEGFEHRKPKKRINNSNNSSKDMSNNKEVKVCLLTHIRDKELKKKQAHECGNGDNRDIINPDIKPYINTIQTLNDTDNDNKTPNVVKNIRNSKRKKKCEFKEEKNDNIIFNIDTTT
jgi:hypothetical protein